MSLILNSPLINSEIHDLLAWKHTRAGLTWVHHCWVWNIAPKATLYLGEQLTYKERLGYVLLNWLVGIGVNRRFWPTVCLLPWAKGHVPIPRLTWSNFTTLCYKTCKKRWQIFKRRMFSADYGYWYWCLPPAGADPSYAGGALSVVPYPGWYGGGDSASPPYSCPKAWNILKKCIVLVL